MGGHQYWVSEERSLGFDHTDILEVLTQSSIDTRHQYTLKSLPQALHED